MSAMLDRGWTQRVMYQACTWSKKALTDGAKLQHGLQNTGKTMDLGTFGAETNPASSPELTALACTQSQQTKHTKPI